LIQKKAKKFREILKISQQYPLDINRIIAQKTVSDDPDTTNKTGYPTLAEHAD
jgi:hypothetical protein